MGVSWIGGHPPILALRCLTSVCFGETGFDSSMASWVDASALSVLLLLMYATLLLSSLFLILWTGDWSYV